MTRTARGQHVRDADRRRGVPPRCLQHRSRGDRPAEATGHVGILASLILLVILLAIGAPSLARLVVAIPAAGAASGYLQAWLKFCAGFGSRGVFNFGPLGQTEEVVDVDARRRDRARARQIGLASLVIGIASGVVAALLPL